MRRLALLALTIALAVPVPPVPAAAQDEPPVELTLVRQTPWVTSRDPLLRVEVRARTTAAEPLEDLALGLTLWDAVRSRSAYDLSLRQDPVPPTVIHAETQPLEGALQPGRPRSFAVRLDLAFLTALTARSLIYPLKVELRSAGEPLAALRTPVVFLVRTPELPLALAWAFELHEPIRYAPDGRFTSTALEEALAPGGWLAGALDALRPLALGPRPVPFDLVVSPVLVDQLRRMRGGYTVVQEGGPRTVAQGEAGSGRAASALAALGAIATSGHAHLSAYPLAAPLLPAMGGGLGRDLATQLDRGRELVAELVGASPDPTLLRPPGGALDHASLAALTRLGVRTLILDPGGVRREPQPLGFAAPPVAPLRAGPAGTVLAVVPDADLQRRIEAASAEDPVLAAQAVLGELAAIWLEQPGVARGIALVVPPGLPGGIYGPLVRRLAAAPFLRPVPAGDLSAALPEARALEPTRLSPTESGTFSEAYVRAIRRARHLIEAYRSMLLEESPLPDALATRLLWAEAGQFVGAEGAGLAFVTSVETTVQREFAKVRPVPVGMVTLTSRIGTLPVRLANDTGQPVRVVVELLSSHLRVAGGAPRTVDLTGPDQTVAFTVELRTTGRFPVRVVVRTPSGRPVADATLVVRSTAFNRLGLVITAGAALVLLALWGRRFLPRTRP